MTPVAFLDVGAFLSDSTVDIGPNTVAVIIALIAFATTVFNGVMAVRTSQKVKAVLDDTKPNGGSSGRDGLNKVVDAVERIETHLATNKSAKLPPPPPPA